MHASTDACMPMVFNLPILIHFAFKLLNRSEIHNNVYFSTIINDNSTIENKFNLIFEPARILLYNIVITSVFKH